MKKRSYLKKKWKDETWGILRVPNFAGWSQAFFFSGKESSLRM